MKIDSKTLESRFNSLPETVQKVLVSQETADRVAEIATENSLDIEQTGIVMETLAGVLLSIIPSQDFTKTLEKEAGIKTEVARSITESINNEVLQSLRRESTTPPKEASDLQDHSAIEQHGNFSVDNSYKHPDSHPEAEVQTVEDREVLINSIENPSAIRSVPTGTFTSSTNRYSEPLVDQLLNSPTAIPAERITRRENFSPADVPNNDVPVPKNLPSDDLYREPIS